MTAENMTNRLQDEEYLFYMLLQAAENDVNYSEVDIAFIRGKWEALKDLLQAFHIQSIV